MAALLQPLNEIVKVMLFDVAKVGVEEQPVIVKSLSARPETASLKTKV